MDRAAYVVLASVMALGVGTSCNATENGNIGPLPDQDSFTKQHVSTMMEHRCGSLDCHGAQGRPLRLYSQYGLRLAPNKDGTRNSSATTSDEQTANYLAVIGLQPEELSTCFQSKGADFATLQLLKKPIDISGQGIRHKGGPVLRPTLQDPGWQCLYGWVSGQADQTQCDDGSKFN